MNKKIHFRNDRLLLDDFGRPFLCSKCPCEESGAYYYGYFCSCDYQTPQGEIGPDTIGYYSELELINGGYREGITFPCYKGRQFKVITSGITRELAEKSVQRDIEYWEEFGGRWFDENGTEYHGTWIEYQQYLAGLCLKTCASYVHYQDYVSTGGQYFNACKINYDGSVYELHLSISRASAGGCYSTFRNTRTANDPDITVTFSLDAPVNSSSMWLEEGKTDVWHNSLSVSVLVKVDGREESGLYYSQNITDGPLSEDGKRIAGVELPFQVSDISVDEEYVPEHPEAPEDVQDPDWYVITSRYPNGGDIISWTYYRGHYAEMEKPFRIYDFVMIPGNNSSGVCGSGSLYVDSETLPDEFE